jgi:hypothetical protein
MMTGRVAAAVLLGASLLGAEEPVDLLMVTRIRDEGFHRSRVMETAAELTDVIGPRLTNSPRARRASEWTRDSLEAWGLANARLEPWGPFGRGWSLEHVAVHMVAPEPTPLIALPRAWTPGTDGRVKAEALAVRIESEADFPKYRGTLAGKVLWMAEPRDLKGQDKLVERFSVQELEELGRYPAPASRAAERDEFIKRRKLQRALVRFLVEEKALATVEPSPRDGGTVRVMGGGSRKPDEPTGVTALVMDAAHYNRVARLLARKVAVELELDVRARFHGEDLMSANTVAEIPGTDKKGEIVMLGAHLDSWHAGTGATDNAAGSAVVMEVMRILRALDVRPRRTIRVALWTGEEQGLLGSRAYVSRHFGSRREPEDPDRQDLPSSMREEHGPVAVLPDHARLSVYFNLDNGTGRIRGVYLQENAAAAPVFKAWLAPFADLGVTTTGMRNTFGSDHLPFDAVGLPGFQFIQDDVEYRATPDAEFFGTHHTNMDVHDRLQREDLMQAAVVMASCVYHAAMRDERFPRKPLPQDPPAPAAPAQPAATR